MSASLTLPWMEIAPSAVQPETRQPAKEDALAALVEQYAPTLYRVAFSVLRNAADAEDAVQEAFLRVLRHRDTLEEVRDQRVWLVRIRLEIVLHPKSRANAPPPRSITRRCSSWSTSFP